jgi:hypothetical protein
VRAPEHRAEDLTLVTTTPVVNLGDIRNNENKITLTPNLQGLSIWLEMEPVSFTAHVPVKYIIVEETFTIPVQEVATNVIGPPLPISFSPKTVKVTVSWQKNLPEANLPTADDISVSFTPIASEIKHNESTYLDLKCVVPQGVTVVSIVPPQVKINWLTSRNYRSLSN